MTMHFATTYTGAGTCEAWLAAHTFLCIRLQARISLTVCHENQLYSSKEQGDLRCAGCGGLNNQPEPKTLTLPLPPIEAVQNQTHVDPLSCAFTAMLQEIIAGDEGELLEDEDDEEGDDYEPQFAFFEHSGTAGDDPFTSMLLAQLQAEDEEPETKCVEIVEQPERKRRVRVFMGRCHRCGGYMIRGSNEHHDGITDDEVYRCYNCSWRTSPEYEHNRNNPGEGWR